MKKARNILVVTLMLLSVLSFGSVANTYAKYTSTAELSDTARVAKWDIEVGGSKIWDASTTVDIFGTDKIIAPGSEGKFDSTTIPTITNKSEVDAEYTITFKEVENAYNIPLEYSTDNGTTWTALNTVTSISGTLVKGASSNITDSIRWRWAYEKTNDAGEVDTAKDEQDTTLGKNATLSETEASVGMPTIKLALSITATQAAPVATP